MRLIQINIFFWLFSFSLNVCQAQTVAYVPDELIIMLPPGLSASEFSLTLGAEYQLELKRTLSKRMNIHVFNIRNIPQESLVSVCHTLMKLPSIHLAQVNHYIENRRGLELFPNDSLFENQWNLHNTGQTGGTLDADVDAPEAWEISTGGPTQQGDLPVIAIVDEGFNLGHPDLPWWVNSDEVPNNGIDDDQNGYVDDHIGWNAVENSPNLPVKLHGTHVAGIAGASGNNGLGISGINWDAQLLPVVGFDLDNTFLNVESNVIAAYSYIYEQRRMYDETAGSKGAFVVATNTSFGLETTLASETPLWCAMFDSLGSLGILNAVATTNINRNVDEEGDVPSTCSSRYVIAVTSTNRNDQFANRGFGSEHIDLAAPGEQILSTGLGLQYNLLTGTSMATPHIAGAISLLFSAACPSLLSAYKNDPSELALQFKELLLQGVDTLPSLVGISTTGGRLNLQKTLLLVEELCMRLSDCPAPFFVNLENQTEAAIEISWEGAENQSFHVNYRIQGSETWESLSADSPFVELTNLTACTTYEFQVQALCGNDSSAITPIFTTNTLGCCEPPEPIEILQPEEGIAEITWNSIFGADSFWVEWRAENSAEVFRQTTRDTSLTISNLSPCINYSLRFLSYCSDSTGDTSNTFPFTSLGCGLCKEGDYCDAQGNTASSFGGEWIDSVYIHTFINGSGDNAGGGDFVDLGSIPLSIGDFHPFRLVPGFSQNPFREAWEIWIDLNRNGIFEASESVFQTDLSTQIPVSDSLFIPFSSLPGETRMRITMRFLEPAPLCGSFLNGEVEDYCVTLWLDSTSCIPPRNLQVLTTDEETVSFSFSPSPLSTGSIVRYRPQNTTPWAFQEFPLGDSTLTLDNLFPCTGYEIGIASLCPEDTGSFSQAIPFGTTGCGVCTDLPYCTSSGNSTASEWIAAIDLGGNRIETGNDNGYGDYSFESLQVSPGSTLPISLEPGFSGNSLGQQWRIWIDWDQNGSFEEDGELVVESLNVSVRPLESLLEVPQEAPLGITRMRVAMRFAQLPPLCEAYDFGEVEDYCITVGDPIANRPGIALDIRAYPNPVEEVLYVESEKPIVGINLFSLAGKRIFSQPYPHKYHPKIKFNRFPKGMYFLEVRTIQGIRRKLIWKK